MKKYKLTDETKEYHGRILYRIEAVRSFDDIDVGTPGGWVESEDNLSHDGDCWIHYNAKVYGYAKVYGNAEIHDTAEAYGYAEIYDNAAIFNDVVVSGYAKVHGSARVCNNVRISGETSVYDNANIYGDTNIYGGAEVYQHAKVFDYANICGNAKICGHAYIWDMAKITDYVTVCGEARISGKAILRGAVTISKSEDYIVFRNNFSSGRYFTYTVPNKMWSVGCFYGTSKELIEKAEHDSKEKAAYYSLYIKLVENIEKLNIKFNKNI